MKMKLLITLLLLSLTNSQQFQCVLAVELNPLEYTMVTRSMSIRIRLSSNCLRLRDFIFEAFFTFTNRISKDDHPTELVLNILDNEYSFNFSEKDFKDQHSILRKIVYNEATLSNGNNSKTKNIVAENSFLLDEQESGSLNKNSLRNLLFKKNPRRCELQNGNSLMYCDLR